MLLLDTSFLIEFEREIAANQPGVATAVLAMHRSMPVAISVVALGEFAEGFTDPQALNEFVSHFRVLQLSRAIAWRTAPLQTSLSRRLGENDAWIAATALCYGATLIGRERAFERVPRLDYLEF
ncbi:MAG TPA: type II toxin-antitoxin system VapC family toxin [Steroidobacteraceae bacterium]|jgi:predicted nucleic acid-binding protein|nr:type II toxin-antitoxin system VapC family toxin [Steroidobacteraceae bacterium]